MSPKLRFSFLLYLCFCCCAFAQQHTVFYLVDAGETKALIPIFEKMIKHHKRFDVIAQSTANTILAKRFKSNELLSHISKGVPQTTLNNYQQIITGAFSKEISHFLSTIDMHGKRHIVVYDAFHIPKTGSHPYTILSNADRILVTTEHLKTHFHQIFPKAEISVMGLPSLMEWQNTIHATDTQALAQSLNLDLNKPVLIVATDYGEAYKNSFTALIKTLVKYKNIQVRISLHPSQSGDFEKSIIDSEQAPHIQIVDKAFSTPALLSLNASIICHRSTTCVFAHFLGYPVLYFDKSPSDYSNWLIDDSIVSQVSTLEHLDIQKLTTTSKKTPPQAYQQKIDDMIDFIMDGRSE